MAETITPVVHGGRRGSWLVSSLLHVAGATASAALLGAALGGAGAFLTAPWETATPALVGVVALVYFAREAFRAPVPLPDRKRQVPEWWRTFFSPPVAAFLYGAGLGVGFLTYLTFGTFAAVTAGAVASGHAPTGALLCGTFGLGRGLAVLGVTWIGGPETVDRLGDVAGSDGPRRVNAAALAGVLVAAVSALL